MRRLAALTFAAVAILGACSATLQVPSRGIDTAVIAGTQTDIDRGYVVDVNGLPGVWIAAHRTSSGGAFRNLPGLEVGAEVDFAGSVYRVVSVLAVPQSWPVHYLGPLVLQTSRPGGGAWLWVCEFVAQNPLTGVN
jgi:hypothetical protein